MWYHRSLPNARGRLLQLRTIGLFTICGQSSQTKSKNNDPLYTTNVVSAKSGSNKPGRRRYLPSTSAALNSGFPCVSSISSTNNGQPFVNLAQSGFTLSRLAHTNVPPRSAHVTQVT